MLVDMSCRRFLAKMLVKLNSALDFKYRMGGRVRQGLMVRWGRWRSGGDVVGAAERSERERCNFLCVVRHAASIKVNLRLRC